MCSLLCGSWFMATFWLGFKFLIYLRSFFSQKSMESDWRLGQGPVGSTSGSPSAGCWHLPGVSDSCWTGRSPGCVSAVPGRGSGRLARPHLWVSCAVACHQECCHQDRLCFKVCGNAENGLLPLGGATAALPSRLPQHVLEFVPPEDDGESQQRCSICTSWSG